MKTICSLVILLASIGSELKAQDGPPSTFAYQGYLTNADGEPIDGAVSLDFGLWDTGSDGAEVWQEGHEDVPVDDGIFTVELGSVNSLSVVPFDKPYWLSIARNGEEDFEPRIPLTSVPFALKVRGLAVQPGSSETAPSPNVALGHPSNLFGDEIDGGTISGGGSANEPNSVEGSFGTVGGGVSNEVVGQRSTIGGGSRNTITGDRSTIGGGENNTADRYATVAGGQVNRATGFSSTIGGGTSGIAEGEYATVAGGQGNEATANHTAIGGGRSNRAEGLLAMVPGGFQSWATGFVSFAAGYNARSLHDGSFVWTDTDGIPTPFASTAEDQFLIRSAGGVGINTNTPQGALHAQASDDDTPDLVVGGTESDDNGLITSDPTLPSSDLNFFSNGSVGFKLDSNSDETNGLFFVTDGDEQPVLTVGESGVTNLTELRVGESAEAGHLVAEDDLGANDTPEAGGVYADNVIYAWAHVQSNGTASASYGCTVTNPLGVGSYAVNLNRALPNGASAVVTVQSVNDPVIATANVTGNQVSVSTKVFNGAAFVGADYGFYIQVVGRP